MSTYVIGGNGRGGVRVLMAEENKGDWRARAFFWLEVGEVGVGLGWVMGRGFCGV